MRFKIKLGVWEQPKSKVVINKGFSWGMNKISKGERCQKEVIKHNGDEASLPTLWFALIFQKANHLISVLFLIKLINSLTFAYLEGLKHNFFRSRI